MSAVECLRGWPSTVGSCYADCEPTRPAKARGGDDSGDRDASPLADQGNESPAGYPALPPRCPVTRTAFGPRHTAFAPQRYGAYSGAPPRAAGAWGRNDQRAAARLPFGVGVSAETRAPACGPLGIPSTGIDGQDVLGYYAL